MADNEEKQHEEEEKKQQEKIRNYQNEKKQAIKTFTIEIKNLSDSITTLMDKENLLEEDLDRAFDLGDEIQEKYEEIIALLFDIRSIPPMS